MLNVDKKTMYMILASIVVIEFLVLSTGTIEVIETSVARLR